MDIKTIIIVFWFSVSANCQLAPIKDDVVNMVISFVKLDDRPTSLLTPNICWSRYTMRSMAKHMNSLGVNMASSLQRNRTELSLHHVLILVDMSCPGSDKLLIRANEEGHFKSPYRWLFLDLNDGDQLKVLHGLDIFPDSDVVVAKRRRGQQFILTEVYKIIQDTETIHTTRLIWRPYTPHRQNDVLEESNVNDIVLSDVRTTTKPRTITVDKYGVIEDYRPSIVLATRRMNLRRHTLRMVNVITDSNETQNHMDDRLFLHQDSISKLSYNVAKVCFDMLNATEKLLFTHTWGYRDKNGNWQGLIDHLNRKKADMGTLSMFTQQRLELVDYMSMAGPAPVKFVFRQPPLAYISNIFTLPFTTNVWLAIIICVLGCSVFLYFTSKWEATVSMHQFQMSGSWADVLVLIMGAVLQQGCTHEPRYAAGRGAFFFLFIALTILYSAYSANIVVLLRAPSTSIKTLPDILSSPLEVGASDFEYNRYYFKNLNEPTRKAIYNKKIAPKGKRAQFFSVKEGIEKVRRGLFVFHMELNPGYRLIQETFHEHEKCDLVEMDYLNEIDPWLPAQKRTPFKDLFKINLFRVRETGAQANIRGRIVAPHPRCSGSAASFSSVGITDMYPALLATTYGMLLAPAVLLLELTYHRLMMIRRQKMVLNEHIRTPSNTLEL